MRSDQSLVYTLVSVLCARAPVCAGRANLHEGRIEKQEGVNTKYTAIDSSLYGFRRGSGNTNQETRLLGQTLQRRPFSLICISMTAT